MQIFVSLVEKLWLYFIVFNVLVYLYSSFKNKTIKSLNFLTLYLSLICINQLISARLSNLGENNLFLFHVYLIIQFVCLSFFYKSLFNTKQKKLVNVLLVLVMVISLCYYLIWPEDFAYFNLPEILITTIPILAYIMIHFYNSLTSKGDYLLISGGLLVYLSISSIVFLLYALLADDIDNKILGDETTRNVADINLLSYFLLQIVIFLEWKLNISKWTAKKVL